jgi:hypothetical protein
LDRNRRTRALIVAASLALIAAAADEDVRLRAENWLAADARLDGLATRPRECLAPSIEDPALAAIGRAAFRTPILLGGQAGRVGLSCASCHRNGRGNPDFQLAGLSGAPGTADVTSSLMSSHRGNGVFDPQPIPDLAHPVKVSRDPADPALAHFVRGLVVEEFDGAEPGPVAMAGLLAYLRALRPCEAEALEPVTLEDAIADVHAAAAAAITALDRGEPASARLLLGGARAALGDIDERYAVAPVAPVRQRLRAADHELLALQQAIDAGKPGVSARIARWRLASATVAALRRGEPQSLYDRARLTALLAAR